jgi:hypothetical protein
VSVLKLQKIPLVPLRQTSVYLVRKDSAPTPVSQTLLFFHSAVIHFNSSRENDQSSRVIFCCCESGYWDDYQVLCQMNIDGRGISDYCNECGIGYNELLKVRLFSVFGPKSTEAAYNRGDISIE